MKSINNTYVICTYRVSIVFDTMILFTARSNKIFTNIHLYFIMKQYISDQNRYFSYKRFRQKKKKTNVRVMYIYCVRLKTIY